MKLKCIKGCNTNGQETLKELVNIFSYQEKTNQNVKVTTFNKTNDSS